MPSSWPDVVRKKEWAKHWQFDTQVQDLNDKPGRNEELKSLEEGMPQTLKKAAQELDGKDRSGVRSMVFIPKFRLI